MGSSNSKGSGKSSPVHAVLPVTRKSAVENLLENFRDASLQISRDVFVEKLFTLPVIFDRESNLPEFGKLLFEKASKENSGKDVINCDVLVKYCERIHGIIDDRLAMSTYLYLYSDVVSNEKHEPLISKERFQSFLLLSLRLYFLNAPESVQGSGDGSEKADEEVQAVVESVFNADLGSEPKETRFVLKFMEENLPNATQHFHKFIVHRLAKGATPGGVFTNNLFLSSDSEVSDSTQLLTYWKLWQLAAIFPVVPFFKVAGDKQAPRRPSYYLTQNPSSQEPQPSTLQTAWQLLYNSDVHGGGTNRFMHHVLGYRGPTVTLILAKDRKTNTIFEFVLAMSIEWKESSALNFADKSACMAELRPQSRCLARERATPWLYFNAGTTRGQKRGLILGEVGDPAFFTLDDSFDTALYNKQTLHVIVVEVWGAGPEAARARQLDVKKWQIREAERQRVVKLTADEWLDHPDRYLLEMSGRTNYVQKEK